MPATCRGRPAVPRGRSRAAPARLVVHLLQLHVLLRQIGGGPADLLAQVGGQLLQACNHGAEAPGEEADSSVRGVTRTPRSPPSTWRMPDQCAHRPRYAAFDKERQQPGDDDDRRHQQDAVDPADAAQQLAGVRRLHVDLHRAAHLAAAAERHADAPAADAVLLGQQVAESCLQQASWALNGVASLPTSRVVMRAGGRIVQPVDVDRLDLAVAVHHRALAQTSGAELLHSESAARALARRARAGPARWRVGRRLSMPCDRQHGGDGDDDDRYELEVQRSSMAGRPTLANPLNACEPRGLAPRSAHGMMRRPVARAPPPAAPPPRRARMHVACGRIPAAHPAHQRCR